MLKSLLAGLMLAVSSHASASPSTDLKAVIDAHWAWVMAANPEYASTLGEPGGAGRVTDISLAAKDRSAKEAATFREKLVAIPDAGLTDGERTDKTILM